MYIVDRRWRYVLGLTGNPPLGSSFFYTQGYKFEFLSITGPQTNVFCPPPELFKHVNFTSALLYSFLVTHAKHSQNIFFQTVESRGRARDAIGLKS